LRCYKQIENPFARKREAAYFDLAFDTLSFATKARAGAPPKEADPRRSYAQSARRGVHEPVRVVCYSHRGAATGLNKSIAQVIAPLPADVKIIPGHGPIATLEELKAYHGMLTATTEHVRAKMKTGKHLKAIQAEGLPAEWQLWGSGFSSTDRWLVTIYQDAAN